ncbi:peptide chain release factor N(5)-glutamine methyltransferase [Pseudogemmatithrix spongiicola]|uniref:Release factor glutamine methyltransferase n=1 Tax=Pseudogemmatithrix spongiicola TaxID=3062599 RepID=A0AA49JZW9_9BACT|nr:peptide chain release factor N(5)-glutamine methyltransferase [Gemmatimonadaceae bacterium 'strain 138']WKW14658.1 peptide chain release factor N(5)-glutamine methyltransferase [Gemmatimonadaceae bacterium 'strain 318']
MVTLGDVLDDISLLLVRPGIPPARAQARDLIAWVLDKPRFWPSANPDHELTPAEVQAIQEAAEKLKQGMPLQYAVGKAPFRHLTLRVTPDTLIPRPETELLVELVIAAQRGGKGTVVDVGTGSGAIALALAAESAFEHVIATDISEKALEVAKANLQAIPEDRRPRLDFRHGDLLAPLKGQIVEAIVSNPPYISPVELPELPPNVRDWEPHSALFADNNGMAVIERLIGQAGDILQPGGLLAMEVDSRRCDLAVQAVQADARFTDVEPRLDLTGRPRFVVARRKER